MDSLPNLIEGLSFALILLLGLSAEDYANHSFRKLSLSNNNRCDTKCIRIDSLSSYVCLNICTQKRILCLSEGKLHANLRSVQK